MISYAQSNSDTVVNSLIIKMVNAVVLPVVEIIFALAVLLFIWGLIGFFKGDPSKRQEGKDHILWGIVGMAIMVSAFGIVRFVASSLGQSSVLGF